MTKLTQSYAASLVLLGVVGYLATGMISVTALIPAFFGAVVALLGWLAMRPASRKVAMHAVVLLAFLGLLMTARGVVDVGRMWGGQPLARPAASISRAIMALLSALYLTFAIRSFVRARRSLPPTAQPPASQPQGSAR